MKHSCHQYGLFEVNQHRFALAASSIREITSLLNIAPFPCSSTWLLGVSHFESEFIPVIDCEPETQDSRSHTLVLSAKNEAWGLAVDSVLALAELECSGSANPPAIVSGFAPAIVGTAVHGDIETHLLDPVLLVKHIESELGKSWQTSRMPSITK